MTISPKDWYDEYYKSDDVIKYFTEDRKYTYSKVADILYSYKIKTVLDIGDIYWRHDKDSFIERDRRLWSRL